jgi:hypothetical protein
MTGDLEFVDLGLGTRTVDYLEAWELQRKVHAEVVSRTRPDTVSIRPASAPSRPNGRSTVPR